MANAAAWSSLIRRVNLVSLADEGASFSPQAQYAVAIDAAGNIAWVGPTAEADTHPCRLPGTRDHDGGNQLLTPGLVDCHTHLVYGGQRFAEWEQRLSGASYEQIARAGGGILSTVRATRESTEEALVESAIRRAEKMMAQGVTTLEIKSGYGLDAETERRMLRAAAEVGRRLPLEVSLTLLAAHTIAPEFAGDAQRYLDAVVLPLIAECGNEIPRVVDAVDVFCESIAFNLEQTECVLRAAVEAQLAVKIHAEQLSNLGGARLAAGCGAWSADHLEYLDEAGVQAMAEAGTVAVLLPGAFYFIHETQCPPIALFRKYGVPMAVATDHNPGSSPVYSLQLALNLASTLFGLTPAETLAGVTIHAARALRRQDRIGSIEVGKQADLVLWQTQHAAELGYRIGDNLCQAVWKAGQLILGSAAGETPAV